MYQKIIFLHSLFRWLVLISLIFAVCRAMRGYYRHLPFTKFDNYTRHWAATIVHIQLMLGITLYMQSPVVKSFFTSSRTGYDASTFFGLIHAILMLVAVVMVTIGSAAAKRQQADKDKFSIMLFWFSAALAIILIAIPWPFSPLAKRPYIQFLN